MSILFSEACGRVSSKCGNRSDLSANIAEAVNSALVSIMNFHETPYSFKMYNKWLEVESEGILQIDPEVEVVLGVAYWDDTNSKWVPLKSGDYLDTLSVESGADVVEKYTQVDDELYVYPLLDSPVKLRILATKDISTITDDNTKLPIPTSLVPAMIMLAASFVRVDVGDMKTAGTLRNFASMLGSIQTGPEARMKSNADSRITIMEDED